MTKQMKKANTMNIDEKAIRSLADLLEETGLNEIEISQGDHSIRINRGGGQVIQAAPAAMPMAAPANAPVSDAAPAGDDLENHPGAVVSPMVGTAYLQPEPSAPSFISVGATVNEGDTLLIVEAMKVMNPIKAPKSGTVKNILISDSQPVEFGEVLVIIE